MAKKKSYDAYVRTQIGDLIDQLELPNLYKHALKDRWLDQMIWADKKAGENRKFYYRLRLITIIGGVILPALVGISVQLGQDSPFFRVWFPPLTFILSQIIAVSVAIEEFCKFGDRWREYRKMAEELKSEGWQYLQSSGPYEYGMNQVPETFQPYGQPVTQLDDYSNGLANSSSYFELNNNANYKRTHLENYAQFANRIESIINNDVQSYINNLAQHQAKQDAAAQKILAEAQAVASNKELIAQLNQNYQNPSAPPQIASSTQTVQTSGTPVDAVIASEEITAAVGTLKVEQDTIFKLSPQAAQSLPDAQKVSVRKDTTFTVMTYAIADQNHFQVTLNQGLGAENRNSWFVFAPHVAIVDGQGQTLTATAPTAPVTEEIATSAATTTVTVTPAGTTTVTVAPVMATTGEILLPVPYFSQRDNVEQWWRTCNTSSCGMAAKYLGAKISGDDAYFQYVIKYGDTTDHDAQTPALTEIGIKSEWRTNLDFEDLDKSLASGLPIVLGILHKGSHEAPTGGGHMILVVGRTKSGDYLVHDPYGDLMDNYNTHNGEKLTYSRHVLTYRWTVDGKNTGWGRLFYGNQIPGATAQAAQPVANSGAASVATSASSPQYITAEQLIQIAGSNAPRERLHQLTPGINQTLETYKINTPLRIAHFIAQVAHESDCFNAMEEYASGAAYEGWADELGNTQPGDGKRFKGRGLIQLTGRSNYTAFSKAMNQDFLSQPEMVAQTPYAVLAAGWFWDKNKINSLADRDDVEAVTRRINGGLTHIEERRAYLQKAKSLLKC